MLGDALIHGSGLVGQVAAQQGVGELQVGVDQPRLVARLERELHVFLPVPHAVGIEPQDLVHQVARMDEVAAVLEPGGGEVELLDATRALTGLDQRLTQPLVRLGIIGIVGNAGLEVLDRGEVPRLLDLREHERVARIVRVHHAIEPEIDRRPAPARRGPRVPVDLDLGRGREIGLELEQWHLHNRLALGRRPHGRALRHDRGDFRGLGAARLELGERRPTAAARPGLVDPRARRRGGRGGPGRGEGRTARGRRGAEPEIGVEQRLGCRVGLGGARLLRHGRLELRYRPHVVRGHVLAERRDARGIEAHVPELHARRLEPLERARRRPGGWGLLLLGQARRLDGE